MGKLVDYAIFEVRYDDKHYFIEKVKTMKYNGEKFVEEELHTRKEVVNGINSGIKIITIFKENGEWKKGADVEVVNINGKEYIRTDKNKTTKDNLGELPEF